MRVFSGRSAICRPPRRAVVTVGVFDGVHRAHQQVIRRTVREARRRDGTSVVVTFDPDPQAVLDPSHAPSALMPLDARLDHLRALGVDWVWVLPFTVRFARTTATQFVQRILIGTLRATMLIVGEGFALGRNRAGDMAVLERVGSDHGMRVVPVRLMTRAGSRVSSSRIRQLIRSGQLARAAALLGYAPALYGTVTRGAGRGRRLGYPTANLRLSSHVLPPCGVYAVRVHGIGAPRRGVLNLGVRPTFGAGPLTCEVHLLDFHGQLRGRAVALSLLTRLRNERRFPTTETLRAQIRRDIARARRVFDAR